MQWQGRDGMEHSQEVIQIGFGEGLVGWARERGGGWDLGSDRSHDECFVCVCVCVCVIPPLGTAVCPGDGAVSSLRIFIYFTNEKAEAQSRKNG